MSICEDSPREASDRNSGAQLTQEYILKFAAALLRESEKYKSAKDTFFFKYLGKKASDLSKMRESFPIYRINEVLVAVSHFFGEKCQANFSKDFSYEGTSLSPTFVSVSKSRIEKETVISEGYSHCEYKNFKFILCVSLSGRTPYFEIYYPSQNLKKLEEMLSNFREYYKKVSFLKGEKLELLPSGFLTFLYYPKLDWRDVILKEDLKTDTVLNLVLPLSNRKYFERERIPWRRGVLLGGQPGVGKTQICRILYNQLGCTVILATSKSLTDEYQVKLLFDAARDLNPTLIILEDLDFIGISRDLRQNPILGELLNQLDGASPNEGVFVLATTNRPELLDRALANRPSRFDIKLELNLPSVEEREKLLMLFMEGKTLKENIDLKELASRTDGLTGAHLKELVTYASLLSLQREQKGITQDDIKKATQHLIEKKPIVMAR